MTFSCAENSNVMFFQSTSATSHPDASLMAMAHQLFQKQQQYQQKQPSASTTYQERQGSSSNLAGNSWPVFESWGAGGRTISRHDSPQPFSRLCCLDALEDLSSSTASYLLEPTSVLDLYSPSLDSMHSPITLPEQQFQDIDQCLLEDVSLTDNPAAYMGRIHAGFAKEIATANSSQSTMDCRNILEENEDFVYSSGEMGDQLGSTWPASAEGDLEEPQAVRLYGGDGSSEWMDCLLNEAEEVGIASCFEKINPCESTQSSELSCYQPNCMPEERWREDFSFACSSSWSPDAGPVDHQLASTTSSNLDLTSLNSLQQQPQQQHHHHRHPFLSPPPQDRPAAHVFDRRDAYGLLTRAGLLGIHLQRKAGDRGLIILQLLLDCVANLDATMGGLGWLDCIDILRKLRELASAYGDPLQRVAFYLTEAITARLEFDPTEALTATTDQAPDPATSHKRTVAADSAPKSQKREERPEDTVSAFRALNEACPYIKFAHLTTNQAILEAMVAADKVHIIDCGIVQGVQWAALLQAFATRPAAAAGAGAAYTPPKIRITGIASPNLGADPSTSLAATGKRLAEFASLLNLEFEFCPVCTKLEDLDPSMLRLDDSEILAVNFMFQLHHLLDDSMQRHLQRTLKLVQLLSPAVITVAEYEASINEAPLQIRFLNAFCFYAAVFDSLDATMGREDPERVRVERLFFAKEINNMMAVEGAERKERLESSENWRRLMERSGFWSAPLSQFATCQARLLLWLYCENFALMEGPGCLSLGWLEHPIVTVSVWHC